MNVTHKQETFKSEILWKYLGKYCRKLLDDNEYQKRKRRLKQSRKQPDQQQPKQKQPQEQQLEQKQFKQKKLKHLPYQQKRKNYESDDEYLPPHQPKKYQKK